MSKDNHTISKARKRLLCLCGKDRVRILGYLKRSGDNNTPLHMHRELKIGKERLQWYLREMRHEGILSKVKKGRRAYYKINTVLVRHLEQMAREITEG